MAIEKTITVPDIGNYRDVEIIEVLVKPGEEVKAEDSLITVQGLKAALARLQAGGLVVIPLPRSRIPSA